MIIGVAGFAQVGKDTVSEYLTRVCEYKRVSFADVMREALIRLNPYAGDLRLSEYVEIHGWDVAKCVIPEIRRLMQAFGTEVGRDLFGENFWVEMLFKNLDPNKNYVISDCRFLNEVEKVKELGGVVWWIHRPEYGPLNHRSEQELINYAFDARIPNDGSIEDLYSKVEQILNLEKTPCVR